MSQFTSISIHKNVYNLITRLSAQYGLSKSKMLTILATNFEKNNAVHTKARLQESIAMFNSLKLPKKMKLGELEPAKAYSYDKDAK